MQTLMWHAGGFCQTNTVGPSGCQKKGNVSPNSVCTARRKIDSCRRVKLSQLRAGLVLQASILLNWKILKEQPLFALSVPVDHSKRLGHPCHAIFVQRAATRTRPRVLGATAVRLANTKTKRANLAAKSALRVPPRYCLGPTPCQTVAARLGLSTSPVVRLWSAFHAVRGWTARFHPAFGLCRQDNLRRVSNSLPESKVATSAP